MAGPLPLFVHMPRTGGTSLTARLRRSFPNVLRLSERAEFTVFLAMTAAERASFDLIAGHMPFGADAFIPRPCRYIVWLRDPVDRFVSSYFHARSHRDDGLHGFAREHGLREFAENAPTFMRDNGQTRRLAAWDWSEVIADGPFWWQRVPIGQVTRGMLDQAKANLDRAFVGLFERFAESARACMLLLGIEGETPPVMNAAARGGVVDDATRDVICERNALDFELYKYALKQSGGTLLSGTGLNY
jgi:hypothetical protein